jgi:hypothetical protein
MEICFLNGNLFVKKKVSKMETLRLGEEKGGFSNGNQSYVSNGIYR